MARAARSQLRTKPTQQTATLPARPRDIVQGIRLHVSGGELAVRLADRIRWHRQRGDVLIEQLKKLNDVEREATDELAKALTGYASRAC